MRENMLKRKLAAGEAVIGCFVPYPSAELAELVARLGFDFVLIDCEHGPTSIESAYHMVLASEAGGATPLIRVPQNVQQVILRYLDIGPGGIMVPQVNSADEARAVVRAAKYHPEGRRGVAGVRAAGFGVEAPLSEYVRQANAETLVIVQIESVEAVERLPAILDVPGIDLLFVGPNDLAQSMGYPGQPLHPEVQAMVDRIVAMVDGRLPLGTTAPTPEQVERQLARGFRLLAANTTSLLAAAARTLLQAAGR
ncbi:HpcH/HpaI aldolase family protein [Thermorudis peleae]|uniref:HpcH/HpaI aldolase family protein n=1 Tax=Thermorudis peleae TaxID=1382356 RepID=UPI00068AB496|nr:aldolase/citrate lyase family protein [Thermorudis peleae]